MLMKIDDKPFFDLMYDYHSYRLEYYIKLEKNILGKDYFCIDENIRFNHVKIYMNMLLSEAHYHDDMLCEYDDMLYDIEYGLERGISQDES